MYQIFLISECILCKAGRNCGYKMNDRYQTVYSGGTGEITEKKSRFIANVFPAASEEEALSHLEQIRKQYWDARHNCWAYVLGTKQVTARCSDDGEPSQTAGKPILDVIMGKELHDVLIVVTRYFGGTLLGTGGLVRAYSKAAQEGLAHSKIITRIFGAKLVIHTDYTGLGKIQYILGQRGIKTLDVAYADAVTITVLTAAEEMQSLKAEITEGTNGQALLEEGDNCWFAEVDGRMEILE